MKHNFILDDQISSILLLGVFADPDIKRYTLTTLYNLAIDFGTFSCICQYASKIIDLALFNIRNEYEVIQELSLRLIQILTFDDEAYYEFCQLDGIEKTIQFVQEERYISLHGLAYRIIEQTLIRDQDQKLFLNNGNMEKVIMNIYRQLYPPEPEITKSKPGSGKKKRSASPKKEKKKEGLAVLLR